MRRFAVVLSICSLSLSCASSFARARDEEQEISHPTETNELVILVRDQAGQPIEGVSIRPYACRCVEDRGSHYGWPTHNVGPAQKLKTDSKGKAILSYPIRFGRDPDWMTTSEISASVSHPEFIGQVLDADPRGGKAEVTMKAGCQLTISAADSGGAPIKFGIAMAGPGLSAMWITDEAGARHSRAIPDGTWQTMLVAPSDDGKHLFSGVLQLRLRDGQAVNIRNLRLKPGLRVAGKLDSSVPRPVQNGTIIAHCIPRPAGRLHADKNPSLTWASAADVRPDGTFEFPSLPREGLIQLITICDTHVGENVDLPNENRGSFRQGIFLQIDQQDDLQDLTIPMEPTGSIVVTVLAPNGAPLKDVPVSTWPNQYMHLAGSRVLGSIWKPIHIIRKQIDPKHELPEFSWSREDKRYTKWTDENGQAVLKGIPLNAHESMVVMHDDYLMPNDGDGGDREFSFTLKDSEPAEMTIQLVAVESAKLSKSLDEAKGALQAAGQLLEGILDSAAPESAPAEKAE